MPSYIIKTILNTLKKNEMQTSQVKACETDKSLRLRLGTVNLGESLPYQRAGQLGHRNN